MNNKDIIILKDIVNEYKDYFCGNYNIINDMRLKLAHIEAIENLLEENRILKDNQTKIIADSFHEKMAEKFDEDFIPKYKIKEKIEKLNEEMLKEENSLELFYRKKYCKEFLEELLQKGDDK